MLTIQGIYASAEVFTAAEMEDPQFQSESIKIQGKNKEKTYSGVPAEPRHCSSNPGSIEHYAAAQIRMICDNEAARGSRIRVMPDVHPGKIGSVGLTMTVGDRILPGLVGSDIGCGVTSAAVKGFRPEFQKLDRVILQNVPSGFAIRDVPHPAALAFDISRLRCFHHVNEEKALNSLGTLGGGNHFIEVGRDEKELFYVTVHSGSRHLGTEVSEFYLRAGQKMLKKAGVHNVPYEMTYLEENLMEDYIHDVGVVQEYASLNRKIILEEILRGMKWKKEELFTSVHNCLEATELDGKKFLMLRKGAVSAAKGQRVLIPANMKDGILLGTGIGNEAWNCSAPHGTGRVMNRAEVKSHFTVSAFRKEMDGIYSSCIGQETLDEAPFAYRGLDEIAAAVSETVGVDRIIRPVYSFKAGSGYRSGRDKRGGRSELKKAYRDKRRK